MTVCAVVGCSTRSELKDCNISLHRFPRNPAVRNAWIKAIRRLNFEPSRYSVVCSLHFEESCFKRDLKIIKLCKAAVPTLFPNYPSYFQNQKKQIATPEDSTSSENEPREDCTSPVPLTETYTFSNHRLPIFKTEPIDSTPEFTGTGWQNNARSEEQVPENTSLLNETSEPDEFTHFGSNVADQLRNMPLEKALLCQVEITRVLSKYVVKLENSDPS